MKTFFLVLFFAAIINIKAQPPTKFYTKFGGSGEDIGYSGKQTLDGHYIVAGSTSSYGNGNTDVYLVKVDSMGMLLWEKYIGGFGNDVGKSVIQLADSGYVIAGFTNSYGAGGYDAFTIRTDKSGNLIWQKTFGGLDWDFASDLVQGADGNIFVVGNTVSFGAGKKDGFVLKYDLLGNLIWQKFYGGNENEELRSIIKTNDNFLATVGYTESRGDINGDGYFLKLNLNGDTLLTKTFGGLYKDYATDIVQKSNSDYILCGAKTYSLNGKTHSYFNRINSVGVLVVDSSRYNSTDNENYVSLANSTKTINMTGYLREVPVPLYGIQGNILVQDDTGFEYAVNSFGGYDNEEFFSIEGTRDGGYLMIGSTLSFGSFGKDIYFLKIDDAIVITYSSIVGIKEATQIENFTPYYINLNLVLFQFQFENIPQRLSLCDLNGKIIQEYAPDDTEFLINLENLSTGLYLLKIKSKDGNIYNQKLIKK